MKGRLHHAPLTQVEISFAREEALAEEDLRALEDVPFHEGALVRDEHIAHMVGVREQVDAKVAEPGARDVALRAMQTEKEPGEIASRSNDVGETGDESHSGCMQRERVGANPLGLRRPNH
jgi:hypothetical protein